MQFVAEGEVAALEAVEQLAVLAQLTGTTPEQLRQALLARTVATGGGELIEKGHSPTVPQRGVPQGSTGLHPPQGHGSTTQCRHSGAQRPTDPMAAVGVAVPPPGTRSLFIGV